MGVAFIGVSLGLLMVGAIFFIWGLDYGVGLISHCFQWSVMSFNGEVVDFLLVLDMVSLSFGGVVCLVSGCVFYYSSSYMGSFEESSRFIWVLFLFVLSMNVLVFFPSMISLIIGWDGLGVSSFLLVVYYQDSVALASGMITALTNRIGDGLIILGMGLSVVEGHWSLFYGGVTLVILWSVLSFASMTKSAQMPFCAWLPAAMAAPTPVSSLVHSSTLVTAGVYLLVRYSESIFSCSELGVFLCVVGGATMLMSGISALFEADMKKIVALSTLSQLGLMVFVLSVGFPMLCLFHVFSHALFKALLFMGVGGVIHSRGDQNINVMGGSFKDLPVISGFIVLSCLSLSGVPFLSGFFSKDFIIEGVLMGSLGWLYGVCLIAAVGLTVVYCLRLCFCVVSGPVVGNYFMVNGDCLIMVVSMLLLSGGAVCAGPWFISCLGLDLVFVSGNLKIFVLYFLGFSLILGILSFDSLMRFLPVCRFEKLGSFFKFFLTQMWFLPGISGEVCSSSCLDGCKVYVEEIESGWVEVAGGWGAMDVIMLVSSVHQRAQNLSLSFYFIMMGLSFFFCFVLMGVYNSWG